MPEETPFFFKNNNCNLFGVLHVPDINASKLKPKTSNTDNHGVVLCCPFAEEKLWSHRVFVNFARLLAKNGYTILRFDYMGHGDSEGDFEDFTVETRLSDIAKSVEVIKEKANVAHVGLLGLRLGTTLAAISAEENPGIDFLILWEPVVKVEEYLQQCLRSNLATQMATYKKIIRTRKEITQDLLNGKVANIDGYLMSGEFYRQAASIDLAKRDIKFSRPVQIVQISRNENLSIKKAYTDLYENKYKQGNRHSELSVVVEKPFWSEIKTYYQEAPNLFQKTLSWLARIHNAE